MNSRQQISMSKTLLGNLPRGLVPGMRRGITAANDCVQLSMGTIRGILRDCAAHEPPARLATFPRHGATTQRRFRRSFITTASRWQENDRRQQVVRTQCHKQGRRRQLRHAKFHGWCKVYVTSDCSNRESHTNSASKWSDETHHIIRIHRKGGIMEKDDLRTLRQLTSFFD